LKITCIPVTLVSVFALTLSLTPLAHSETKPASQTSSEKNKVKLTKPTDGMKITKDTVLAEGVYILPNGIEIAADGVTLDGNGAVLIGKDFKGSAVRAVGRKNITIKNICAERYYHGIRIENCSNVTLEGNRVTNTAELDPGKYWLDIWLPAEKAYGAGVILINTTKSRIANNHLAHQQNGILMYGCSQLVVEKNDTSYESGFGIHLYDSSDNVIQDNLSDFCNRVHARSWGRGDYVGADATGLLMVHNSSRNKILRNKFRAGGDGVFLAGYFNSEVAPCNNNLFEENDCSLSPNNAFESTFCEGNIFRKNKANQSNFGFWLGFSTKNEVIENEISNNRLAGIAIDTGNNITISKNRINNNRFGVLLWVTSTTGYIKDFPNLLESHTYTITDNDIRSNRIGINSTTAAEGKYLCRNYVITGNTLEDNRIGVRLERVKEVNIEKNRFVGNQVENIKLIDCADIKTGDNNESQKVDYDPDNRVLPYEVH